MFEIATLDGVSALVDDLVAEEGPAAAFFVIIFVVVIKLTNIIHHDILQNHTIQTNGKIQIERECLEWGGNSEGERAREGARVRE